LEKEILVLKRDHLELMTLKRETERKLKENRTSRDSKKVQELETTVEQLRHELIEKTRQIEMLQQNTNRSKGVDKKSEEELKALTERAKGAESQRDALQLALRQLRERQTLEAKKSSDRIRQLEGEKDKTQRHLPRTPERTVTGITHRTPEKRNTLLGVPKNVDEKVSQLKVDLSKASKEIADLSVLNTQLSTQNTQLRDMQQRLQTRLSQVESAASASTISEASATASLSYAHRLAVEMARVTDFHMKSLEKVRNSANTSLPFLKSGGPLSPMLRSSYDMSLKSEDRLGARVNEKPVEEATVKMMESRIKELEGALKDSSDEMGEVVRKMQTAQIEMIELASERDEAVRRERKLMVEVKSEVENMGIPV
jgi:chromosome segregation ATPase